MFLSTSWKSEQSIFCLTSFICLAWPVYSLIKAFLLGFTSLRDNWDHSATFKLYLWRNISDTSLCIISDISGHLCGTCIRCAAENVSIVDQNNHYNRLQRFQNLSKRRGRNCLAVNEYHKEKSISILLYLDTFWVFTLTITEAGASICLWE
jgi:hypothetical protein